MNTTVRLVLVLIAVMAQNIAKITLTIPMRLAFMLAVAAVTARVILMRWMDTQTTDNIIDLALFLRIMLAVMAMSIFFVVLAHHGALALASVALIFFMRDIRASADAFTAPAEL